MKIRPKNSILYAATGVRFSSANAGGANWRQQVFNNYRQHLLDQLAKYGEADDYGNWLNEMQHRHSGLWNAANQSGNWEDIAYENEDVGKYQQDYRGGLGNDNNYQRFGEVQLNPEDKYDFNQTGIKTNQATRYNIPDPPKRVSGDFSRKGYNYKVDNYYSAITDDRRLLGRKGDWDENSQEYKDWIKQLNDRGWTMELDESDQYYKLKRLGTPDPNNPGQNPQEEPKKPYSLTVNHTENYGFDWNKIGEGLRKYGPDLFAAGRLAGNLWNNERVFRESEKGIRPDLKQTYYTHRQVVGDEAAKQGYYRRAAQGQTAAARPFTSDADRQMAYQMEAKRVGDEMRAQGDLADNQEIRRTSDESNQHQWANTQRATEVANANIAAINYANALRQNLRAQKQSADWTSIDNELLARETRMRQKQARADAIRDQIWALDSQNKLQNDPEYLTAYDNYRNAYDKAVKKYTDKNGNVNYSAIKTDPEFRRAQQDYQNIQYRYQRQQLEDMLTRSAKEGMKFTFKSKDDLLYKTARDAADHFRKMSKISSDAHNRKRIKIEKLTSHPKGNARRKYQQGGAAPFTIYRPATLGGETTTSSQTEGTTTSSSKASSGKDKSDTLDMVKKLFEAVAGKGLPSDVNSLYNQMQGFLARAEAFGTDLSTEDIASMYLQQMQQLNAIQYLKANYDSAEKQMVSNNATNEFAIDYAGRLVGQKDGEIVYAKSLTDAAEKGINPLTNGQLLQLRAMSPALAQHTELDAVAANGVGMTKIAEFLKSQLPKIGSSESTIEGYTKKGTNDIINGLRLLQEAPEGDYKYSNYTKEQKNQAEAAIKYLKSILPQNMRKVIEVRAEYAKITGQPGGTENEIIASLVGSGIDTSSKIELDAVTGKAAKDANGNSKSSGDNDMIPALAFFNGLGEKETFIIQDKTQDGLKINTISAPITSKGSNTGSITFDKLQASDFGGQLNMNQATMGDALISSTGRQNIVIDGRIYQAELPIDQNAKNNEGIIKPDLRFLKNIEAADMELRNLGIDKSDPNNVSKINEIYKKHNLPILYTISNNKLTITSEYARFAIVNGIGTEDAFGDNPEFNDAIQEISSDTERKQFEQFMQSNNSKYKLDNGYSLFGINWGETKLYKGTIYIPMVSSNISALGGTGYKAKGEEYNQIEAAQQAADAARKMGFNPAGDASNL